MEGLLSSSELGALREVAELGMIDDVGIYRRSAGGGLEGDDDIDYGLSITVKGWLWEPPLTGQGDIVGGIEAINTAYRLYLPVGTPISNGDRVFVNGGMFEVVGTNAENTYRPVLRCSLRRAE